MKRIVIISLLICLLVLQVGARTLIHEDQFVNNSEGWFTDNRMIVRNGRYEFFSSGNAAAYSWMNRDIADGEIEVDTTWTGGLDSHGYGIIFRLEDEFSYYFFWIAAQGYYITGKAVNNQPVIFSPWTRHQAINVNGRNTLRVKFNGSQIDYYVNNVNVSSHQDTSFSTGGYGFYTQQNVRAAFDNFSAWKEDPPMQTAMPADIEVSQPDVLQTAIAWRGMTGKRIAFTFPPGGQPYSVWGTGTYTDDSSILSAAVHAGVASFAQGGRVVIEITAGQDRFSGTTANGVTTLDYGSWPSGFTVLQGPLSSTAPSDTPMSWTLPSDILALYEGPFDITEKQHMQLFEGASQWGNDLRLIAEEGQYATIANTRDMDFSQGYTVSMRIKFHSWANNGTLADNQYIIEYPTDTPYSNRSYIMRLQLTGDYNYATSKHRLSMGVGPIKNLVQSSVAPTLGQWHTITASYNGLMMKLYLDGNIVLVRDYVWTIPEWSNKGIFIGVHNLNHTKAYHADISLDSLFIWNRALSDYEVTILATQPNIVQTAVSPQPQPQPQPQPSVTPTSTPTAIASVHNVFAEYQRMGTFGGSVYLKNIFNKEAYPAYIAFYPVKETASGLSVQGEVLYTATNSNGFYKINLPEGDFIGVVYDDDGYTWPLITGDGVFTSKPSMRVHHFKIDNTVER